MIKYSFKLITILFLLVTSSAFAGYIETDLTEDTYITYGGYDWTWASPVNTSVYKSTDFSQSYENIFKDADSRTGWMTFISGSDLDNIFRELTLVDFTNNGRIIHSAQYWNSFFTEVDSNNFHRRKGVKLGDSASVFNDYETFYVRSSVAQAPAVVPEPTTLFIFGAGLLGFAIRKRKIK
jgi:hypothetical protein